MSFTTAPTASAPARAAIPPPRALRDSDADIYTVLQQRLAVQRRLLHAGDIVCQAGERFVNLFLIHSGSFKIVNTSADGREQVVALHFKGDWLGFDGIAGGQYGCDAIAMDTGEVWSVGYNALLQACSGHPALLPVLHGAMSLAITRERNSLMSLCTLSADERVADFLCHWVESLARRGLRTDQITLRMTRAEIGGYLGMTLESVSRALTRFERAAYIRFAEKGRREVQIVDVDGLACLAQRSLAPRTLQ
jgi:CRP/FNR family transcriptional regulator